MKDVAVIDSIPRSDHDGIIHFNVSITSPTAPRAPRRRLYDFKRANFDQFSIPWDCCFLEGGIEEAWNKFKDLFLAATDQYIPSFTLRHTRTKSWLSDEVLSLVKKKRRAYRVAKRTGKSIHQCCYKSLSNTVRNLTRRDQNLMMCMSLLCAMDPSKSSGPDNIPGRLFK